MAHKYCTHNFANARIIPTTVVSQLLFFLLQTLHKIGVIIEIKVTASRSVNIYKWYCPKYNFYVITRSFLDLPLFVVYMVCTI